MKEIPGYEGKYAVTEDGRVWSYPKPLSGALKGYGYTKGKWLKPIFSMGYPLVNLGAGNPNLIHRLVAITYFGDPIAPRTSVNHKDGVRNNNHISNLEWCSQAENTQHAWKTGLCKSLRKIHPSDVPKIRAYNEAGETVTQLSERYKVGRSTIQRVLSGTHGYI